MNKMKFKALTIMEIVVTLAISTFVIMIALMAYFVVSSQFTRYKNLNTELQTIYELQFLLQKDIEEADSAKIENDSILLVFKNINSIVYKLQNDYVVRKTQLIVDTIHTRSIVGNIENPPLNQISIESSYLKKNNSDNNWPMSYIINFSAAIKMVNPGNKLD